MKLGCKEDAELIYRRRRTSRGPLPKGWKKLGEGTYRSTYLSPAGVVYKVAHPWEQDTNIPEYNNYLRIRNGKIRLPKGWAIAPAHLYSFPFKDETVNVVAMKYIEGKHEMGMTYDQSEAWFEKIGADRVFEKLNLYDLHEGNFVVTPEGKYVIIDLGA